MTDASAPLLGSSAVGRWRFRAIFLVIALLCMSGVVAGSTSASTSLREAEAVRHSDIRAFRAALARATALRERATPAERDWIDFLTSFDGAIRGEHAVSIATARRLAETSVDPKIRIRSTLLVANVAGIARDYELALLYLRRAIPLLDTADSELRETFFTVAATVHNQLGYHAQAHAFASRQIAAGGSPRVICAAHENLTRALSFDSKDAGESAFIEGRRQCTAAGISLMSTLIRSNHGRFLVNQGRYREAIALLRDTLPAAKRTGYFRLEGEVHASLASAYRHVNAWDAARSSARTVLTVAGQHPHWEPMITAHQVLYEAEKFAGRPEQALLHYQAYRDAREASLNESKARAFAAERARVQSALRERDALALKQSNGLLRMQKKLADERERAQRLVIVVLALLIAGIAYVAWRFRAMHREICRLHESDPLTGLASATHFSTRATKRLQSADRVHRRVDLFLIRLEHLDGINLHCGHSVGDWVLRTAAAEVREAGQGGGLAGRVGGATLALLLDGLDDAKAAALAYGLESSLSGIDALGGGCHLSIRPLIGRASSLASGYDYRQLLGDAQPPPLLQTPSPTAFPTFAVATSDRGRSRA